MGAMLAPIIYILKTKSLPPIHAVILILKKCGALITFPVSIHYPLPISYAPP